MSYFAHETAVIDEGCSIGDGTKIWHFSHIMAGCVIGENCNFGQNVVVSPKVVLGNNVRVQNNVSIYEGVICEDDVFRRTHCSCSSSGRMPGSSFCGCELNQGLDPGVRRDDEQHCQNHFFRSMPAYSDATCAA